MLDWIIVNVICPCLGTVAFAIMFNVPKRFYVSCGIIGTLGWLVYCAAVKPTSPSMASFFASLTVVLISRVLTVRMKCPITMFLIPGIFPLIPGASVYYMAYDLVIGETREAGQSGFLAIKVAFGIVLGIVSAVSIPREVFGGDYWRERKTKR
ncbi:MAG: threonine/serine exporter [Dorea sp.]|nr:threonine/serine exporter [Dorea sp.]MCI9491485.1 threonine/serine exporter [Dorea sp.]